ncbi:MAG: rhodanese-like domain-containing protein [Candidatus Thorarchaeota archaeon]
MAALIETTICVADQEVRLIQPLDLKLKLEQGQDVLLLDIREALELQGPLGHLEGIKHMSLVSIPYRLEELEENKDQEIIAICRRGLLAPVAAELLIHAGFPRVSALKGGMLAWRHAEASR